MVKRSAEFYMNAYAELANAWMLVKQLPNGMYSNCTIKRDDFHSDCWNLGVSRKGYEDNIRIIAGDDVLSLEEVEQKIVDRLSECVKTFKEMKKTVEKYEREGRI